MAKLGKKESAEVKQIRESLEQAERLLQDKIYQLGQAYYMDNCDKSGVEPKYREMMDIITRIEANRKGFEQEKLRLEGLMTCGSCGNVIPFGSVYCSICGRPASPNAMAPQSAAAAYAPQPAAPAYAPQPAAPAFAPQPAAPAYAPQPAAPAYAPTEAMDSTATLGEQYAPNQQPVSSLVPPSDNDMAKPGFGKMVPGQIEQNMMASQAVPAGRVCPSCGEPLEDDSVFCANCGTRV